MVYCKTSIMKCVAYTLLLCTCIVVTSHAQNGIHITQVGNVGIGDETPYSRLTLSGTLGYHNGTFPLNYIFENGESHPKRALFAHSPNQINKGLMYDDQSSSFLFGNGQTGVWLNIEQPAIGIGVQDPFNSLIVAGTGSSSPAILRLGNRGGFDEVNSGTLIFDEDVDAALTDENFCGIAMRYNGLTNRLEYLGDCTENTDLSNAGLIMSIARDGNVGGSCFTRIRLRSLLAGIFSRGGLLFNALCVLGLFGHRATPRSFEASDEDSPRGNAHSTSADRVSISRPPAPPHPAFPSSSGR